MTITKASTVAQAIIAAGYAVRVYTRADGEWVVHAYSGSFSIPVTVADNFATSQTIAGSISEIEYV
jgi:hypothetical protein